MNEKDGDVLSDSWGMVDDSALFQSAADPSKGPPPGGPIMVTENGVMKPINDCFSAKIWAEEFMKTYKMLFEQEQEIDEGLMIGWFANAIMAGYDHAARKDRKVFELIAGMCGTPDAAQGCRNILKLLREGGHIS